MQIESGFQKAVREGEALSHFIKAGTFPADIKDAKTGKYVLNNLAASEVSGLLPEERIGLDIYDIGRINNIKESALETIVHADHRVSSEQIALSFVHIFLDHNGPVIVDRVIKKPVLNYKDHLVGILSYAYNINAYIDRFYLFSLYKSYYSVNQAIKHFLQHLKLMTCFNQIPQEEELALLLTMRSQEDFQYASDQLKIKLNYVKDFYHSLCKKLNIVNFDELVTILRKRFEYSNVKS